MADAKAKAEPKKAGRKSKAEELGLLALRPRLKRRLPKLDRGATEDEIIDYLAALNRAFIDGLCTSKDAEVLQQGANLILRGLRQKKAGSELDELEQKLRRAEAVHQSGTARAAAARQGKTN